MDRRRKSIRVLVFVAATIAAATPLAARAQVDFEASWDAPTYQVVREEVLSWLSDADLSAPEAAKVRKLWPARPPESLDSSQLLDLAATSFAASSDDAAELVALCNSAYQGPAVANPEWLLAGAA
jgi:hypothetical protein